MDYIKNGRPLFCLIVALIALQYMGGAYLRNTFWRHDLILWNDVAALSPAKARGHINLGTAFTRIGGYDVALEKFFIALELDPFSPEAHNNIGAAYSLKGLFDEAIGHYENALRLRPGYPDAYNNLGVTYEKKGMIEDAIKNYQSALKINPRYNKAENNLTRLQAGRIR